MSELPTPKYPSPRPTLSLFEYIDYYAKAEKWDRFDGWDHFETRATFAEYSCWVLQDPKRWLTSRLSIREVGRVMDNLPRPSGDARLPVELRTDILKAEEQVFTQVFEPLLGDALINDAEPPESREVAIACFMWFDNAAFEREPFAGIFREFSRRLLGSSRAAVQEAILHGLGHHIFITEDVEAVSIVKNFLHSQLASRGELNEYASQAMKGNVL